MKFPKSSHDNGDAEKWLSQTVTQFKQYELSTSDQLQALPYLLEDIAYLWYVEHMDLITSFASFNKLFLQQFSSTSSTVRSNTPTETVMPSVVASSSLLTSHLQRTITAVIQAFGSTKVQELAFEQLKWYKQSVNQSITQYYNTIIELCGVKESLKLHIALYDPQTIESFLSYARKIEDTLSFIKNDYTVNQHNESQDINTCQQSLSPIATLHEQIEHDGREHVQHPQQKFSDINGENNSSHNHSFNSSQSRYATSEKSSITEATQDGVASCYISSNPSSNESPLLVITTLINDKYMKAMIDMGTTHTFISMKTLFNIRNQQFINSMHRQVFVIHGNIPFPIYGEMTLSIKMGMDFINKYKLHINLEEQTMSIVDKIKQTKLHIDVNDGQLRVPVRLINNIRIKPKQTVSVPVFVPLSSYRALFRPSFNLQQHTPLVISSSLISVNDYTSFIYLYNPKSYSQTLSKGIILGTTTISTLILKNISTINKQPIYKNPNNSSHPNSKVILGKINQTYLKRNMQPLTTASVAEKICNQIGSIFICPRNKPTIHKRQPDQFDINQLKIEQSKDPHIQQKIKELKQTPNEHLYVLQDGVLYKLMLIKANCLTKVKLIYSPSSMIDSFIKVYHTDPIADYSSIQRIYLKLKNKFWWPNMKQSIIQYINTCLHCHENSNSYIKKPDQVYTESIISKQNSTQLVRNETTPLINLQHVNDIRSRFIKSK
ncbi:unnamed protein product [Rotaria sp. Silwood1]|nr:unnamed protein product [Rotaria sp. Silwood1]